MNLDTLFMFAKIVESGSMTQAAEQLHISQPALTQQIKSLENQLHCCLLERSNKGVLPTADGNIVYEGALELQERYHRMLDDLNSLHHNCQALRVAATPFVYSYALPCTLFDIKKKFTNFSLEISAQHSCAAEVSVANHKAEIGLISGKPENTALSSKLVFSDRMYLTAGADMSCKEKLTTEELYQYPLLMLPPAQKTRKLLNRSLEKIGVDLSRLQILYHLDSVESIRQSAINGYGLAFLPYMAMKKELYGKQLRIIELEGFQMQNDYYMIKHPSVVQERDELPKLISYLERTLKNTMC